MGRGDYSEFLKVDHTGYYKRIIPISNKYVYFVAKKVVGNDSTDYNVIRTLLPDRIIECSMSQHEVTIALASYDWQAINESEFLLSKIK